MKSYRARPGRAVQRPYYTRSDVDAICTGELARVGLLPVSPEPIRIERFIEKRFGFSPEYRDLGGAVLGATRFGPRGAEAMYISSGLENEGTHPAERRLRSTLAHEAGHALLHGHLFALGDMEVLFENELVGPKILCRDEAINAGYNGRWWEYQANMAIGSLLLPKQLVEMVAATSLKPSGSLGLPLLEDAERERLIAQLATSFDVNPVVARIRVGDVYPQVNAQQMRL